MAEAKIYEAISNVMKEVGAVSKNDTNKFDNYKFRGIDAVMNALHPAMVKNHVFVTPEVLESFREERASSKDNKTMMYTILKVKYTFYTDDGSSVESVVIGEAMDRSDKSTNKAMSAAFKYACFQTFCIPTEEMQDSEIDTIELDGTQVVTKNQKSNPQKSTSNPQKSAPNPQNEAVANQQMIDSVDRNLIPEANAKVTQAQLDTIKSEMQRTGINMHTLLTFAKAKSIEEISQTTAVAIINNFARTPSIGDKK